MRSDTTGGQTDRGSASAGQPATHAASRPGHILPVIVFSQFAGTSIWFSGNAVLADISVRWPASTTMVGWITSAVQLGFIIGTLIFAVLSLADRFSARWVFLLCAAAGAAANLSITMVGDSPLSVLGFRFVCGFFLAGIYPVGMKIAAGWYAKGLGNAMGFLVGALVLGTAFPHLANGGVAAISWQSTMALSSAICLIGGLLMFCLVPDGPYAHRGGRFNPAAVAAVFSHRPLRAAACGYFGHMWELYTLWAFIPLFLGAYVKSSAAFTLNISFWSFLIIGIGSVGCIGGGLLSRRFGSATVARGQLWISCFCCLGSPFFFGIDPSLFIACMLLWGITVVGDSPQFSTIVARTAPPELVGSALTLVNCIGFSITIASLSLLQWLTLRIPVQFLLLFLACGPAVGLFCMHGMDDTDIHQSQRQAPMNDPTTGRP